MAIADPLDATTPPEIAGVLPLATLPAPVLPRGPVLPHGAALLHGAAPAHPVARNQPLLQARSLSAI